MINTQLSNKIFKKCVEFNAKEDLPEIEKNEDESDMELTNIDSDNSSGSPAVLHQFLKI